MRDVPLDLGHMEDAMDAPENLFAPGEKAVYLGHGLVEVQRVELVMNQPMYVLFTRDVPPVTIRAPVGSPNLRRLLPRENVAAVFGVLAEQQEVCVRRTSWVRRSRALAEKLRTTDPFEVAEVFRDLHGRRNIKDLSFGERKLIDRAESLLVDELAAVLEVDAEAVSLRIHRALAQAAEAA